MYKEFFSIFLFSILLNITILLFFKIGYPPYSVALAQTNPFMINNSAHKLNTEPDFFSINKTVPFDGELGVGLSKKISITFNSALNTSHLTNGHNFSSFVLIDDLINTNKTNITNLASTVKGKFSLSDDNQTLIFRPNSALAPNRKYSVLLIGKDYCDTISGKSNNMNHTRSSVFIIPYLTNETPSSTKNIIPQCGLADTKGHLLNHSYNLSFITALSPPIITNPESNFSSNKKIVSISGSDPNHSQLVQIFKVNGNQTDKNQKPIGLAIPFEDGSWRTNVHFRKDGIYNLVARAVEPFYNKSSPASNRISLIIDTHPPIVNVPADMRFDISKLVKFTTNATDNLDGTVDVNCSPLKSGDIFPIGTTKITCKAVDRAFNEGEESFLVNVTAQDALSLNCRPNKLIIVKGDDAFMRCTLENKIFEPLYVSLSCSNLKEVGIDCYVMGRLENTALKMKSNSSQDFDILVSSKSPAVSPGSYPFKISAHCKDNSC
jgi:hypothetical protein